VMANGRRAVSGGAGSGAAGGSDKHGLVHGWQAVCEWIVCMVQMRRQSVTGVAPVPSTLPFRAPHRGSGALHTPKLLLRFACRPRHVASSCTWGQPPSPTWWIPWSCPTWGTSS
jgi:hypothetical protein